MRRTKEEAQVTRRRLLQAALVVFSRSGYSAASLEEVAAEAGVTRGAIYWHFKSKADLYGALLDTTGARSAQIVQEAAARGGRLADVLRRIFVRLLEAVESDRELRAVIPPSWRRFTAACAKTAAPCCRALPPPSARASSPERCAAISTRRRWHEPSWRCKMEPSTNGCLIRRARRSRRRPRRLRRSS